jgi:hypothetical protein
MASPIRGYLNRRRARESAIPAGTAGSEPQPPGQAPAPQVSPPPTDLHEAERSGGSEGTGPHELNEIGALIRGALEQGNIVVSTADGVLDLGDAGLRNRLFEAVEPPDDPPAGGDVSK